MGSRDCNSPSSMSTLVWSISSLLFLLLASLAHAEPVPSPPPASKEGPVIRGSVGNEGVQPGSQLYETELEYRKKRAKDSERSAQQMAGTAGIASPRPGFGESPESIEERKSRANRVENRIKHGVDPSNP